MKYLLDSLIGFAVSVTTMAFLSDMAAAATIGETNATRTSYAIDLGEPVFTWDTSSLYKITGTEVITKANDIILPVPSPRIIGTVYEFVIPNFYDPLPRKDIEIEMKGANPDAGEYELPSVLDIIGADSDFYTGGPALAVDGMFMSRMISPGIVTEYWAMFPNPDFEVVKIYAPIEYGLQEITISTQSVPVPAAAWLFGSGLLGLTGLAGAARRRRTN